MSRDMKAVIEALLPPGAIWRPRPGGDFDKLLDGMGDNSQVVYDFLATIAEIRNPRTTPALSDLEKEYGVLTNLNLTETARRDQLVGIKYAKPDTASDDLVQDKLRAAGFDGIIVTSNDPAIDPALIPGELLVNGPIYVEQTPAYLAQANGASMYAGNGLAVAGYYLNIRRTAHAYALPSEWRYWRYVFFVGGAASGWPGAPAIATLDIDYKKEEQLKRLILAYKPLGTWFVLVVDFVMFWTHQTASPAYIGQFQAATSGDGLQVVAGQTGQIETSPDGITWTKQTPDGAYVGDFYGATYGNGQFVLVGTGGEIQTSPDGVTWTAQTAAATFAGTFYTATYGNGVYTIAGANAEIQTSPDGITWTHQAKAGAYVGDFRGSTHGNNQFVLVGTIGEIQTSPDGVTWTHQTNDGAYASAFRAAAFGNGVYTIAGQGGEIQSSHNAVDWTARAAAATYGGDFWGGTFGNGRFVLVGTSGEIQSSPSGETWKEETNDGAYVDDFWAAAYGSNLFTVCGDSAEIQTS